MNTFFHVMIATERRVSTPEKPRELAIPIAGQLHTMGASIPEKWGVTLDGKLLPGTYSNEADAIAALADKDNENYTGFDPAALKVVYVSGLASAQIIYAASWDQVSPWIVLLKGDRSTLKMGYLGWPLLTEADWIAANPKVVP